MNVWLVKDAEPLPIARSTHRMRMGRLADALVQGGHDITWWHSTFYHFTKSRVARGPGVVDVAPGYRLRLIEAGVYGGNLSWSRYRHHRALAAGFLAEASRLPPPDVIVAAFPIPWFAHAAITYAVAQQVPSLVDVRDLWPDIFVHKSPAPLRPIVRWMTHDLAAKTAWLLSNTDGIVAVSAGYLQWALARAGRGARPLDRVLPLGCRAPAARSAGEARPRRIRELATRLAGCTVAAFAGSFGRSYDLATVCDAAERLAQEGRSDIHFVIAGDGEQHRMVMRRASTLPNVTLPGWLDKDEMDALLGLSSLGLVCCISVADTMPNKVFEYLASGLPLVSSLEGETERLIRDHDIGISYRAGDGSALAAAVRRLADDPECRRRQSANARRLFSARFDAAVLDREYVALVESVVKHARRVAKPAAPESLAAFASSIGP